MSILSYILRVISLSFLFAGSTSIIFAAITLVNAAKDAGIDPHEAAAANAPMFTMFSTVVLICAFVLLIAESLHYAAHKTLTSAVKARYGASLLCVAAALVLKFGIIPGMEQLTMHPKSEAAHAEFKKLHEASRMDFGVIIVASLVSLLMPGFENRKKIAASKPEAQTVA